MKILVIGQTPPPYGGQAINIEKMLHVLHGHSFDHRLIRLNFSDEINDMGRFSIRKSLKLVRILLQLFWQLAVYRPSFVYYPPAGPQRTPIFRDIILLFPVRLFGFRTIFHFHAGGVSETYHSFHPILRAAYRFAYNKPDYAICLSEYGKKDPLFLKATQIELIPSGVEDITPSPAAPKEKFVVLFAGLCCESKGILDFIETIRLAKESNPAIIGRVLGKIFSKKEEKAISAAVAEGLISYEGVQKGEAKHGFFRSADAFLFPSFFESENFPTVILEAFAAGLPVVATDWRGIPDQVTDGFNGFIHDIHDTRGMAASIIGISGNAELHKRLSANARHDFETKYTMSNFEAAIVRFFKSLA